MNLPDTIYSQAQSLPVNLQREALDFMVDLQQRCHITPATPEQVTAEAFISRFAGSLGDDFPDDIDASDWANTSLNGLFNLSLLTKNT